MDEVMCYAGGVVLLLVVVYSYLALKSPGGLSSKHHGELNAPGVAPGRYDVLRSEYEGDGVAQQQIDVYDGSTEYHGHVQEFIEAIRSGDTASEAREGEWLGERYPDV